MTPGASPDPQLLSDAQLAGRVRSIRATPQASPAQLAYLARLVAEYDRRSLVAIARGRTHRTGAPEGTSVTADPVLREKAPETSHFSPNPAAESD